MLKYWDRITKSARGEIFNPLLWPFLLATLAYSIGFAVVLPFTGLAGDSSLYSALVMLGNPVPIVWGWVGIATILGGMTFLLFNIPPFGKVSGIVGFMLWVFAAIGYMFTGSWLTLFAVAIPNMIFWFWQYLSLSHFRKEDAEDKVSLRQRGFKKRHGRS